MCIVGNIESCVYQFGTCVRDLRVARDNFHFFIMFVFCVVTCSEKIVLNRELWAQNILSFLLYIEETLH